MNSLDAVTDLALYICKNMNTKVQVFKFQKRVGHKGEYIVVNALPFVYGRVVNDDNALNLNLHIPDKSNGDIDSKRFSELSNQIYKLIPTAKGIEDGDSLLLNGVYYSIKSVSNPIEDKDGTHFINFVIDLVFTDLKSN